MIGFITYLPSRGEEAMSAMNGKKRIWNVWLIAFLVLTFTIAVGWLGWTQLRSYEESVMEVYAHQQDGYVQLVLDQINLNKDRSQRQIIEEILGTLDESSNKYWTLSQKDALVFVKDVTETGRYRGYSTETYYKSESAQAFLAALETDRVIHRTVQLGERSFVASGVQFQYQGVRHSLCLLTSADVVLDTNAYLSAKINVCLLALIELSVLVLTTIGLAALSQKWKKAYEREVKQTAELRNTVEQLNSILGRRELYDTRLTAFRAEVLPQLFQKLEERNAWPVHFTLLNCDNAETQDRFLSTIQNVLDRRVFRVILGGNEVLLLSAGGEDITDQAVLSVLREPGVRLSGTMTVKSRPVDSLEAVYRKFYQDRVNVYGAQTVS